MKMDQKRKRNLFEDEVKTIQRHNFRKMTTNKIHCQFNLRLMLNV